MSIPSRTQTCPDCEGKLRPIRILDKTEWNANHTTLEYAEVDAKPSAILRKVRVSGTVKAYKCQSCRRIFLYG